MLFTDPHRTESKQNSAHANHGIRHSLPVSGDINLVDLGRFSREKNYFSFVFIKFLLPIRNKYIMSYKITRKYFSVHIHFKELKTKTTEQCKILPYRELYFDFYTRYSKPQGILFTFDEFQNKSQIKSNYLQHFQLITAIPFDLKKKAKRYATPLHNLLKLTHPLCLDTFETLLGPKNSHIKSVCTCT